MKNKSLIFSALFLSVVAFSTLVFNSCEKDANKLPMVSDKDMLENLEYKDIIVSDINNENSIVMRISSQDASLIDYYSEDNFIVIPINEGQSVSSAVHEYYEKHPLLDESEEDMSESETDELDMLIDENEPSVNAIIVNKILSNGVRDVAVTVIAPDFGDERARFSTVNHYSWKQEKKCYIERTSLLHKVYYGLSKKTSADGAWSEIVSFQTKLNNHDPQNFHHNDCYQYDLTVRRRKSKHYTYSFTD